jgi:HPt (histidine-containing phosphotransfer) domain-containing protein
MTDFAARMDALRSRFIGRAGEDAVRLRAALAPFDRAELLRTSHAIVGSAGMFGFSDLGDLAARVEDAIDANEGEDLVAARSRGLIAALDRLVQDA